MRMTMPWVLAVDDAPPSPPPVGPVGEPGGPVAPHSTGQPGGGGGPGGTGGGSPQGGYGFTSMLPVILVFALVWFVLIGGQRRESKKRASMIAALKKGDRVVAAGGILGTVMEVRDQEVVLKVDENNNTKLRVVLGKIDSVIQEKE